ncbi:MAG: M23 family metallopeptidase [Flavobacteriales bacterium]
MTLLRIYLLFLLLASLSFPCYAQTIEPGYFGPPMDIPLHLAGSFAELRTNHFHMGLDIKTQQREGINILSCADGYVSRVKVSPFGYGYALYVTHPNGFTTVYAHLKSYAPKIDSLVKAEQYRLKTFSLDHYFTPSMLPVVKGEIIGLSGNTGSSSGPHLHFEIRKTATEEAMNPLLFGFDIQDHIPPSLHSVWIVPLNESSRINGKQQPASFELKAHHHCGLTLKHTTPPKLSGDIGFAINTTDMLDGNSNTCGIFTIELFVDSALVFGQKMNEISFDDNRAMNAHTIYKQFKKSGTDLHRSYRLPGNPLNIYYGLVNEGIVTFSDDQKHHIQYVVTDVYGNVSTCQFDVQSSPANAPVADDGALWKWEEEHRYDSENLRVFIPKGALYEDLAFSAAQQADIPGAKSDVFQICNSLIPLHQKMEIAIRLDSFPAALSSKCIIVRYDADKNKKYSEGGKIENGWIKSTSHYFGRFHAELDTIKPSIDNVSFNKILTGKTQFSLRIHDRLSDIDQIIPEIDGQWALMEFDAKSNLIHYYLDERYINHGPHQFKLRVLDGVGNERVFEGNFEW